jgi:hypothetical protein
MELDVDYAIAEKYSDCHDFYSRNLNVFRSFIRVFEAFFKKQKYQNAEIKIEEDAKNKATIKFCGKKFRVSLVIDPEDLNSAFIWLLKISKDQPVKLAAATIAGPESVVFPGNNLVSLKDSYEFNNAVLNFFISGIAKKTDIEKAAR